MVCSLPLKDRSEDAGASCAWMTGFAMILRISASGSSLKLSVGCAPDAMLDWVSRRGAEKSALDAVCARVGATLNFGAATPLNKSLLGENSPTGDFAPTTRGMRRRVTRSGSQTLDERTRERCLSLKVRKIEIFSEVLAILIYFSTCFSGRAEAGVRYRKSWRI